MEFEFGSEGIRKSFRQKEEWAMINHGSYGLAPNEVLKQREMLDIDFFNYWLLL